MTAAAHQSINRALAKAAGNREGKIHVIARKNDWIILRGGQKRAWRSLPEKSEAVALGKQLLQTLPHGELVVHDQSGMVESRILQEDIG